MEKERVQKILSERGVCSRRKAESYIQEGRVKVNGVIVSLGDRCLESDLITLDDKPVLPAPSKRVVLKLNKPLDVVSTLSDPQGRRTVADLVPAKYGRLFPVGRLDQNSTGLMLMTNDGAFANLITHPSSAPEKEYVVKAKYAPKGDEVKRIGEGLYIIRDGYTAAKAQAKILSSDGDSLTMDVILHEGKKREVRHMLETLGHPVLSLRRVRIGNILLGPLPEGKTEEVPEEILTALEKECVANRKKSRLDKTYYGEEDEGE